MLFPPHNVSVKIYCLFLSFFVDAHITLKKNVHKRQVSDESDFVMPFILNFHEMKIFGDGSTLGIETHRL